MTRIDLDDLPPRVAQQLAGVAAGEEVLLVRGGVVEARLVGAETPAAPAEEAEGDVERMGEVMEHFRSMIEDDF
ncbi:hypothetical protein [Phenylobacterium sp.]|uniref:hypothetical protein n=1 Tax=Phenylobacterium sp. TaxID=1871053 RepID=UPI0035B17C7B